LAQKGKNYLPKHGQINKVSMLSLCEESSDYMFDRNMTQNEWNILDIGSIFSNKGQAYLDKLRQELKDFQSHEENLKNLFHITKNIDDLIIDYLKLFVHVYAGFGVPIRFNFLNANELRSNEALRITIEALLPSEQKYLAVSDFFLKMNLFICILN